MARDLVGTVEKQISFVADNIPGRKEVNTHSTCLSESLTKSIEIKVDIDYLKQQPQDASVQCELIGGPMGTDISTSMEDFDS